MDHVINLMVTRTEGLVAARDSARQKGKKLKLDDHHHPSTSSHHISLDG
jgi:hypothetical protein